MKKKYFIICAIIIAVFSSIIIPMFCVNKAHINNNLAYSAGWSLRSDGNVLFDFYVLDDTLPDDLIIDAKVHITKYNSNTKKILEEFDKEVTFTQFNRDEEYLYKAEKYVFSASDDYTSYYMVSFSEVKYSKDGKNYQKMKGLDLWETDIEDIISDYEKKLTLDEIYSTILIVGYIALTLAVTMPFIAKGVKSLMKRMAKFNIGLSKEILEENKKDLSSIANQHAEIMSDAMTTTAKSLKKGFKQEKQCKHCGAEIEENSKFCNNCGKEQK